MRFPRSITSQRLVLAGVFVAALALYLPNLANGWAWDDHYLVQNNPAVHTLRRAPEWFLQPWSAGSASLQGRLQNALYWRPVTQASYALDWVLSGGRPWLFHLTNDLLHALASALTAWLVLLMCRGSAHRRRPVPLDPPAAAAAALVAGLLFAVHPVHTEPVNMITYRTTLLSATAVLAALGVHLAGRTLRSSLAAAALFAVGLMSKENAIVLPALAVLFDLALRSRPHTAAASSPGPAPGASLPAARAWRRWVLGRYLPMALVAAAYLVVHAAVTGPPQLDFFAGATRYQVVLTMLKVVAHDLRLMLVPWPLTPFYDWSIFPVATSLVDAEVLGGGAAALLLLGFLVLSLVRGWPVPLVTIGTFVIALTPYLHIVTFFDVTGERFLYLPSAGVCVGAGLGLGLALRRRARPRLILGAAAALVVVYASVTAYRTPHFASSHALLVATVERFPESFAANFSLGTWYMDRGKPGQALPYLERAHRIDPRIDPCTLSLSVALEQLGRHTQAKATLRGALVREGHRASPVLRRHLRALACRQPDDPNAPPSPDCGPER